MGSFCAESSAGTVTNNTHRTTRSMQELEASRIRYAGESVCLYRLRCDEVNGPRCLFRAASRKAQRVLFTADLPLSSMQEVQRATSRRASLGKHARRFLRETGRRDLRRPSGHPASLRLSAKSGTRGSFKTHTDAALPNPQRREFLSPFSSRAPAQSGYSRLCRHELPSQRRLRVARLSRAPLRQFASR